MHAKVLRWTPAGGDAPRMSCKVRAGNEAPLTPPSPPSHREHRELHNRATRPALCGALCCWERRVFEGGRFQALSSPQ